MALRMGSRIGRPLLAGALFLGVPMLPVGTSGNFPSADCVQWAYDVTSGAPRLFWLDACAQSPDSLVPFLDEEPGLAAPDDGAAHEAAEAAGDRPSRPSAPLPKPAPEPPAFPLPLDSGWRLSSPFGPRIDPFTGQLAFHHGVDLAVAEGTPVRAYDAGQVIWAGPGGAYGLAVGIRHENGRVTWYGHLSEVLVHAGDFVRRGQEVGRVGATGRATGPHLHFEIRENGRRIDPWPELASVLDDTKGGGGGGQ